MAQVERAVKILVTGMSGAGKSTALQALARRGHRTVDTDSDAWSRWVALPDGARDWIWREDEMRALLTDHRAGRLYVSGCKSNQGMFYPYFDHIVLLTAPEAVLLNRIALRDNNPYGKSDAERAEVLRYIREVEPLLLRTATDVIDTSSSIAEVVGLLEALGSERPASV